MAVELYSENSGLIMSPRISFSHDLSQSDSVPVEQLLYRSNSSSGGVDFDFCIRGSYDQESSSADELFSDGKLLPTQIKKKKKISSPKQQQKLPRPVAPPPPPPPEEATENSSSESLKESGEKQGSKSFWRFKRSSSCGSGYARSLCPLPPLLRSNSTGSSKDCSHSNSNQQKVKNQSLPASGLKPGFTGSYQKPPLKKSYGNYPNGVRINPVLNVPSSNLFGLGSIFSSGKDKSKKK